ncbi:hypothetical protein E4U41_003306 [Claviceps citrina]|nr:hypothetical protein E4U41_003306 [Claviceps citrina]
MAPLTGKRKTLNRDNEDGTKPVAEDNEEGSDPTIPLARGCTGRGPRSKRPQRGEGVASVALSGTAVGSKKDGKKTRATILEAKRSVERMAGDLKKYIEAEMCSRLQTEESSLVEVVASVEMAGDALKVFPLSGACVDKAAMKPPNETYESAMRLLAEYRAAVREYGQLTEGSGTAKMPSWLRWEKDSADLHELNTRMLAMATHFVQQHVVPTTGAAEVEPGPGHEDVEQIAWELLEDAHAQKGAETWGNAAETMMQNMRGIMALLS